MTSAKERSEKKPVSQATKIELVCLVAAICVIVIWAVLLLGGAETEAEAAAAHTLQFQSKLRK